MATIFGQFYDESSSIPDMSHLKIKLMDYNHPQISYVAYVMLNNIVVAFGKATYFFFVENELNEVRHLILIENLVSNEKGYGSMVLYKIEEWINEVIKIYGIPQEIRVIVVDGAIGFYEEKYYFKEFDKSKISWIWNYQ
jgi:hypothetical protein